MDAVEEGVVALVVVVVVNVVARPIYLGFASRRTN